LIGGVGTRAGVDGCSIYSERPAYGRSFTRAWYLALVSLAMNGSQLAAGRLGLKAGRSAKPILERIAKSTRWPAVHPNKYPALKWPKLNCRLS
jgi:hypothetical protein